MNKNEIALEKVKQEDKKNKGKFLILLLCATLIGGLCGAGMGYCEELLMDLSFEGILKQLGLYLPAFQLLVCAATTLLCVHYYRKGIAFRSQWSGEVDEIYDAMEENLSIALAISQLSFILLMTLFGITFSTVWLQLELPDATFAIWLSLDILSLIYCLIFTISFQKKIINFEKVLNPEKQGSVYDMKFQKKWMDSCDELEQLQIYKSGFHAYQVTNSACIILWMFTFFTSTVFHTGFYPVLLIGLLWFVSTFSYLREAHRLSKPDRKTKS